MTKLMKEQVKFFIETMTDDMHNTTQHEIAETLLSKFDECESLQAKLLAYEQAAKNPAAIVENSDYMTIEQLVGEKPRKKAVKELYEGALVVGSRLYAAPVLPKQPEHSRQHFESLYNQFWNWAELDEIDQDEEPRLEWNGSNYTHRVTAALWKMYQAAPTQPALVEKLKKVMNSWLAMEPKLAFQPEFTDVMMLLDAEAAHAQPVIPDNDDDDLIQRLSGRAKFLRDKGEIKTPELIEAAISALSAQPVSEPYKLEIDMDDADHFSITHLHEIIYGKELIWPEAKLLARFMLDVKQRVSAAPTQESE